MVRAILSLLLLLRGYIVQNFLTDILWPIIDTTICRTCVALANLHIPCLTSSFGGDLLTDPTHSFLPWSSSRPLRLLLPPTLRQVECLFQKHVGILEPDFGSHLLRAFSLLWLHLTAALLVQRVLSLPSTHIARVHVLVCVVVQWLLALSQVDQVILLLRRIEVNLPFIGLRSRLRGVRVLRLDVVSAMVFLRLRSLLVLLGMRQSFRLLLWGRDRVSLLLFLLLIFEGALEEGFKVWVLLQVVRLLGRVVLIDQVLVWSQGVCEQFVLEFELVSPLKFGVKFVAEAWEVDDSVC